MSTRRRAEPANEHALPHQAGPARSAAPGDPGAGVPDDPGAGVPGDPGAAGAAPAGERAPAAAPVLSVTGLRVGFPAPGTRRVTPAVRGIDLTVRPGECLALVGQSGSGKSVTARALLGLVGGHAVVEAARLRLGETDLLALSRRAWRRVRGARIGMVLQDALTSLDPLRPVGREIDDALRLHTRLGPAGRRARMLQALADAGIADPELRAAGRSDELSGGQRQRALIAAAIVLNPALIIADEPTTALDVAVESQVLDTFGGLRDRGTALLLISHDLSVVARVADRVAVMHDGLIVEEGTAAEVLRRPRHPYTVELVGAVPEGRPRGTLLSLAGRGSATNAAPRPGVRPSPVTPHAADALRACVAPAAGGHPHAAPRQAPASRDVAVAALELRGVSRAFHTPEGTRPAVDDVTLTLAPGRTLGLVGASGSGKTTTARIALGLTRPDAGTVTLFGEPWAPLPEAARRARRGLIGAVYQDAASSFDPRRTVGATLADALSAGRTRRAGGLRGEIVSLLASVGLGADLAGRHPTALSGGQRQRVAIARAIAAGPKVLVCDEPTSSLDVLVQARVLDLLDEMQRRLGLAYLFISHDLGVIRHVSDEVAVMEHGRIVAQGPADAVLPGTGVRAVRWA